ncbi:hypothetical protein M9H77_02827 [Catharanthus roseus]|uniref:Uncharacterized protein n=1 Tax=Catharanthus roseus TaxID=4058 RepID=A0ACC0C9X7_CATRO|nr:hypothetical protein M9H77_02827 [Catharanthus roseus]
MYTNTKIKKEHKRLSWQKSGLDFASLAKLTEKFYLDQIFREEVRENSKKRKILSASSSPVFSIEIWAACGGGIVKATLLSASWKPWIFGFKAWWTQLAAPRIWALGWIPFFWKEKAQSLGVCRKTLFSANGPGPDTWERYRFMAGCGQEQLYSMPYHYCFISGTQADIALQTSPLLLTLLAAGIFHDTSMPLSSVPCSSPIRMCMPTPTLHEPYTPTYPAYESASIQPYSFYPRSSSYDGCMHPVHLVTLLCLDHIIVSRKSLHNIDIQERGGGRYSDGGEERGCEIGGGDTATDSDDDDVDDETTDEVPQSTSGHRAGPGMEKSFISSVKNVHRKRRKNNRISTGSYRDHRGRSSDSRYDSLIRQTHRCIYLVQTAGGIGQHDVIHACEDVCVGIRRQK